MDWVRGETLGQGSFGTVSLAFYRGRNPSLPPLMAVKSCGASLSSSLANEKSILLELEGCPEIIRCYGDSFSFEKGESLYNVLLEYASGGSLADRVKMSGDKGLSEFEVRRFTKALLRGLSHIHRSGYVHGDVKLQNMLLCADGAVRFADFGLTRLRRDCSGSGCEVRGTPMYMSPEMVSGGEHGTPADVWALGCAVAEMAGGAPAWDGLSVAAMMMRIGVGDHVPEVPPKCLSGEGRDFLEKCFVKDPRRRWTAEMLLSHPFIGGDDGGAAALKMETAASISPRCIFDYPEWLISDDLWSSEEPSSTTVARLRELVCDRRHDWSLSGDWVTVR